MQKNLHKLYANNKALWYANCIPQGKHKYGNALIVNNVENLDDWKCGASNVSDPVIVHAAHDGWICQGVSMYVSQEHH